MAGKKDNSVAMVFTILTVIANIRAVHVAKEMIRIKNKTAPFGRGIVATGKRQDAGELIQRGKQERI